MSKQKFIGIIRVRNEEEIIFDSLSHAGSFLDGIVVYDDCSTDRTTWICENHPKVIEVIRGTEWATDPVGRNIAEGNLRQEAYNRAVDLGAEWVYCFDADEFAIFPSSISLFDNPDVQAWRLRLFDYYITKEDKNDSYKWRKFIGREYRDILMIFKVDPEIRFFQREPHLPSNYKIGLAGDVKHYGKAISIKQWEDACKYYINHRGGNLLPEFSEKWRARKGKAIHTQSDFGSELIPWEYRHKYGIPLSDTPFIYQYQ